MLKKCFISAFPEIEKISQNLGPKLGQTLWKIESLMKRCIGSTKPHRTVFRFFARYCDAEEEIHKRISWNWENISKSGPKVRPNIMKNWIFNEKVHRIRITFRTVFRFFARYYDAKKWFISAFPEIEKISQNLGPKLGQTLWKIESLMKSCIWSEPFFAFSEEVIHKRISRNWENISKSGPKVRPNIMTNWIFNEKVHRIQKISQKCFSLFRKILRCWRRDS